MIEIFSQNPEARARLRNFARSIFLTGFAFLAAVVTSCTTVGVDYARPGVSVPNAWTMSVQPHVENEAACLQEWWKAFQDPALNTLISRARCDSPDVSIAIQRIVEARAQRGVALSALFPAIDANGAYTRTGQSARVGPAAFGPTNPIDVFSLGTAAAWEIDVFGGLCRQVEAADANIEVSVEEYRDLLVTLFAEVALNYIDYRTFEERVRVARQNIVIQNDSLSLAESRLEAGLVSKIDVTQAEANLQTTRATVPQLEGQLVAARNRLATLTGGYPHSVDSILKKHRSIPIPKKNFAMGAPADLLRARPDIRSAERNLAVAVAQIGVTESELYPKFSLMGDLTLQASDISSLLDSAAAGYSFGPSFRWNLFRSGQIKNLIRVDEARAMQAYAAYEKSVLVAVEEVETSMVAVTTELERRTALRRAVSSSAEAVELVKSNYTEGLVDFQRVIDSQRVKFQNEDLDVISRGQIARNYVGLYRALGGGAALEEVTLPAIDKKPGGGWIKKRPAPYAKIPAKKDEVEAELAGEGEAAKEE
ncbi:MAG: efflux transporter outer membrane subunit [Verrucomicrobiales bacterium]|nr:efflux transporter outer membrane subunit [Verrucomicrobiales bacterium]